MKSPYLRCATSLQSQFGSIHTDSGWSHMEGSCERPFMVDPTQSVIVIVQYPFQGESSRVFLSSGLLPWSNACLRPVLISPFPGTTGKGME